jgi:hypothetical protein
MTCLQELESHFVGWSLGPSRWRTSPSHQAPCLAAVLRGVPLLSSMHSRGERCSFGWAGGYQTSF